MSDIKYCKQEKPASEKDLLTFRVLVIKNTLDFAPLLDEIAIETQLIGVRWDNEPVHVSHSMLNFEFAKGRQGDMSRLWRRMNWRVVLVWCVLFLVWSSPFSFAADKLSSEAAYLSDVYANMMKMESVHYDITIKAITPMGDLQVTVNGDAQEKPLRIKEDIYFSYRGDKIGVKEDTFMLKRYMEQIEDKLVLYSLKNSENEKWTKQPMGSLHNRNDAAKEKAALQMQMLQLIKAVKVQKETPSYKYLGITLDTRKLSDLIGEEIRKGKLEDKGMVDMVGADWMMVWIGLAVIGDVIKVDKAAKIVTTVEMGLTEPTRDVTRILLDTASPREKADMESFLDNSTIHIEIKYSNYNQVAPIEVPQEVRDTARYVQYIPPYPITHGSKREH